MIRNSYDGMMDDFADWFIAAAGDGEELRDELKTYYATAFEFIVIGAAHLENSGVVCRSL
jgi:hypothetical protein